MTDDLKNITVKCTFKKLLWPMLYGYFLWCWILRRELNDAVIQGIINKCLKTVAMERV